MDQEFDIRPYLQALLARWYWIIISGVLLAIAGAIIANQTPPSYQATALVAITGSNKLFLDSLTEDVLDPNITSDNQSIQFIKAFPELALSDDVLLALLNRLDSPDFETPDFETIEELRLSLIAEPSAETAVLRLIAVSPDPNAASQIANSWATVFINWTNTIYSNNRSQLTFFEEQLTEATLTLNQTEAQLVEFELLNRTQIIQNELDALNQAQKNALNAFYEIEALSDDVGILKDRLVASDDVTFGDDLVALNLQIQAFNLENESGIQIQVSPNTQLVGNTKDEQLAFVTNLEALLNGRLRTIEARLEQYEPDILQLQQALEGNTVQYNQLSRGHDSAMETYVALTRKVEEERINLFDNSTDANLFSTASVPNTAVRANWQLYALAGAAIGSLLAIIGIIGFQVVAQIGKE